MSGALIQGVMPKNGVYLTLEEVKENAVLSDDVHACPTKIISLENTLGGTVMPLEEVEKISRFAKENGIILHLDGARLWVRLFAPSFNCIFAKMFVGSCCGWSGRAEGVLQAFRQHKSLLQQGPWGTNWQYNCWNKAIYQAITMDKKDDWRWSTTSGRYLSRSSCWG